MAYADQKMSGGKMAAIVIVVLIHAVLGYAFVTGLAFNVVKKVAQDLKTFDVEEEPPPPEEEPPPPPPEQPLEPPPVVAPPPIVQTQTIASPVIMSVPTPPPPAPPAPPAPPPPPPAPVVSKAAGARGDPARWISNSDYPARALREEREGTTAISWDINAEGRVENCRVTSSSGSPDLDEAACNAITRRGRYQPALDQAGNAMRTTASRRVVWRIPDE